MNAESIDKVRRRSRRAQKLMLLEPIKLGAIVGLYLWVAGAPFGFFHPDEENWAFFWRLLPLWRLPGLTAFSVVGASAFLLAFVSLRRKSDQGKDYEALRSFKRVVSPIYFLLLAPVQLIPGTMAVLPVLPLVNKLILPVSVFSSTLFLFLMESGLWSQRFFRRVGLSISSHKWRWSLAIFLVSLLAYGLFMRRCNRAFGYTGGDEAHYLTQAQSLAEDLDRDLVNQLPDFKRTRVYFINKHLSAKSAPGKAYSCHSIGVSVLLAPGWAIGKVKGALAALVAISSLFATTFFWAAFKLRQRSSFAIGCWAVFCFTAPIIFYACRAYPGVASGLVLFFVAWKMLKPELLTGRGWLTLGCLLGLLPWLQIPRLSFPAFLMGVWGIIWLFFWGKRKNLAFFAPPLFVGAVLLIALNQHWYGYAWGQAPGATGFEKLDPAAWTGGYYQRPKDLFSCWPGLLGSIVGRYEGLLVCSPVYFVPLLCLVLGLFSKRLGFYRRIWLWIFLAVYIPSLSMWGWYGGACFPSRYLIPVLPLLLFPFASILSKRPDRLLRAFFAVLAAFSVWIALRMAANPAHFYRGAQNARWYSPSAQLIALFYPYGGSYGGVNRIEDPLAIVLFAFWVGAVIWLLQAARRREMPWHRSFNLTVAAILTLPLLTTAVRRILNYHPYRFSVSGALEHHSTLMEINRPSSSPLHTARWGKIAPETLTKEMTFELPAVEHKSKTGDIEDDESLNQKLVAYRPGQHKPGYLSYTYPVKMHRGRYFARFWLAAEGWHPQNCVIVDVQDMATADIIAAHRLTASDLPENNNIVPVSVPFAIERYSKLSFRIYVDTKTPFRVLKYSLEPASLPEIQAALERATEK